MAEGRAEHIIHRLQKKWTATTLLGLLVASIAFAIVGSAIAIKFTGLSWGISLLLLMISFSCSYFLFYKKMNEVDVAMFLNKAIPAAEESATLVLRPANSLSFLERLQLRKLEAALPQKVEVPASVKKKLRQSIILLLVSIALSCLLFAIPIHSRSLLSNDKTSTTPNSNRPEVKLAEINVARIIIAPPSYTGKAKRTQDRFNITAEQGALISWAITTTAPAKDVQLLFNDKSIVTLKSSGGTQWATSKKLSKTGFYQVKVNNNLSELYRIEMIKDQPPKIVVQTPKPATLIEPGQPQTSLLNVVLNDDYGISNAFISATIASGTGEAVKFKEQQFAFSNFAAGGKNYQLQKFINLPSLGMKPGDELYFYISATDNFLQEKRSDIYIVRIEDTAQLMEMEGLANGIDIKPEFFRSQRQIIIETEQLLRSRDTVSVDEFNKRSNELGVDQKLLRLRYGKFLGEETNVELGTGHGDDEEGHTEDDAGDIGKLTEAYEHKHDNVEDATFFDVQTKKQLRATLTEMWKAELQLRTYKPKDALPFEYKALKLLKELQQQTRVYVAKTGIKTTPLKPEKRLTGELDKVVQPVNQFTYKPGDENINKVRRALSVLEQLRSKEIIDASSQEALEEASIQLSDKAAAEPSTYLPSLQSLRKILKKNYTSQDINRAGSGLHQMLSAASRTPQQSSMQPSMKLSQRYFRNLTRRND
jgi:hypothetical protein